MGFDDHGFQRLDPQDLDRHITGNYGEDSVPYCNCPCMDCIEGQHCGAGDFVESFDGEGIQFECQYLVEEFDDRADDFED